jgi:Lipocalin-like domain
VTQLFPKKKKSSKMHIQFQQLIGLWKLLYVNVTDPAYDLHYGPNLIGRIIITQDHYFNAMLTDLPGFPNGTTWQNATDSEKGLVAKRMTVYEGPVTLVQQDNLTFTHTSVEDALNPDWVGTLQVRQALLEENGGTKIMTLIPWAVSFSAFGKEAELT